ncbi:MAG TPA: OsmC family protein [Actinomycetota bacterium]|jgi:putative redox protein|nr:OsmC family protein [Actinomycetota bacterium]
MEITAYWEKGYRCRVPVRSFEIIADEPPEAGGDDTGPAPTEIFLASLASCFAMAVAWASRKRGVELPDLAVRTRGRYLGLGFDEIRVEIISSHPREELEEFVKRAIPFCYVSNTLKNQVKLEYVVADEQADVPPHVHE